MLTSGNVFTRLGSSLFWGVGNNAIQTIVSAAANVRGVIIRTAALVNSAAGANQLWINSQMIYEAMQVEEREYRDIFIPPGQSLLWVGASINQVCSMTYDIL